MKKLLALLVLTVAFVKPALSQNADAVLGTWLNEDKDAKVLIYKTGTVYSGKIIWLKNPYEQDGKTPRTDSKNSSEGLRKRAIQNLVILSDFTYKDEQWEGGKIYDPKSGKTYKGNMKLDGSKLSLRGYVGIAAFGETTVWTKSN